ncbi:MAG: carbohydrate ABC transporter permease [Acidimicrobiales bacterium]
MIAVEQEVPPASARRRSGASPEWSARRRRRGRADRLPYGLLLPSAAIIAAVLGYPLYKLFATSFQHFGLRQLFLHTTDWTGLANYQAVFTDGFFWTVVLRTVVFTAVNVALTIGVGMLVALLLKRVGRVVRTLVTVAMIMAWVMPSVTSPIVWGWLFETQYGVVNWLLTQTSLGNFTNTDWFGRSPLLAFTVITLMVVWQAVPFVALSLYAGLSQVPGELYEAAWMDGGASWAVFRRITLPMLKPILLLLTILSTIWDFSVFNQIWILTGGGPNQGTVTLGIWSYIKAFGGSQFGEGAAIAVVSVILLVAVSVYYVRQLVRSGEVA